MPRLSIQGAFFRAHINTDKKLLTFSPRVSKQGAYFSVSVMQNNTT